MSMIGNYLRIPDETLNDLLDEPSQLSNAIYPEEETPDWLERRLDIDKSWHIIHFLLNGKAWEGDEPYVLAVLGGQEISDEDVGYGPGVDPVSWTPEDVGRSPRCERVRSDTQ